MDLCYPTAPLTTGEVTIRPWRPDDLGCVAAAATDPAIPPGTTVPAVPSDAAGRGFLLRQHDWIARGEGVSQAIADPDGDRAIGLVFLARRPQPWIAGVGYWLIPEVRGRGLAARAVDLLAGWALTDLDVLRLEAWVDPDNHASRRTLDRAGFAFGGRLRRFLQLSGRVSDALVFSRVADDPDYPDDSLHVLGDPEPVAPGRGPDQEGDQPCR